MKTTPFNNNTTPYTKGFIINHVQEAPVRLPAEERELITKQIAAFKKTGGKIQQIPTGVTAYTEMTVKEAYAKKAQIKLNQTRF